MPDLLATIDALARRIATPTSTLPNATAECGAAFRELATTPKRQLLKVLTAYAREHKARQQFGRLCGVIVVGTAWLGDAFVRELDLQRLLVGTTHRFQAALAELVSRLAESEDSQWALLIERINTHRTLFSLQQDAAPSVEEGKALRRRPFLYGKALMALADWAFRRHSLRYGPIEALDRPLAVFRSPEDVAAAVSAVLAVANDAQPLESMDFTLPLEGPEFDETCAQLVDYGRRLSLLSETEKLISVLGYRLMLLPQKARRVYKLDPPSPDIEYALRLGFVRGEIGVGSSRLQLAHRDQSSRFSIMAAVSSLVDSASNKLIQIKDPLTRHRRLRTLVPLLPSLYEQLASFTFYEDEVMQEKLAQELEIPLRVKGDQDTWELVDGLDLRSFQRAWRALRFISLVDVVALRRYQADPRLVRNSLMRVIGVAEIKELLSTFGLSATQASSFLGLVSGNVNRLGHLDLQYRPFLELNPSTLLIEGKIRTNAPEIINAPALVALSNVLPNIQRSHSIRVSTNAEALVAFTAEQLKRLFKHVRTNAAVKLGDLKTDIDVVALGGHTLYLFECKHSLTPTGAHEFRDLWTDINKGVSQLEVASTILSSRLSSYLAGWFPGTKLSDPSVLTVKRCVLCSHRVFSGLTVGGIPVRDHASFSLTLGDATVQLGYSPDGQEMTVKRYRLRKDVEPVQADLDEYLKEHPMFFKAFERFMHGYTRLSPVSPRAVLAEESFKYEMGEEEWLSHLESLGAVRLADERVTIGPIITEPDPPSETDAT